MHDILTGRIHVTSTRTMLLKMCLSCLLHMSDEQLGRVLPLLTSIAEGSLDDLPAPDELETRVFACLDALDKFASPPFL